jgi:hypothetical protein
MSRDNSNPAFPVAGCQSDPDFNGMSLRDYFAGEALKMIPPQSSTNMRPNESHSSYVARRSYEYADAMLKAREA